MVKTKQEQLEEVAINAYKEELDKLNKENLNRFVKGFVVLSKKIPGLEMDRERQLCRYGKYCFNIKQIWNHMDSIIYYLSPVGTKYPQIYSLSDMGKYIFNIVNTPF